MNEDYLAIIITIICLTLVVTVISTPQVANHGYVVVPATDADSVGQSGADAVRITFWELPPRLMLVTVIQSISPILLVPFELFFFIQSLTFLGYRKITAGNVLGSPARSLIFEKIQANPGIYFNELSRETGLNRGSLRYHLALMRVTGKISTLAMEGDIRYFENSGRFSETEQKVLKFLRNDKERAIFVHLMDNPESTRGDLEKILGISGAAVTWHTNRLCDAGMLKVARSGKTARYLIDPDARTYLEKYLADTPEKPAFIPPG
ncbi:MAG: Crp/Fnr family transcriptional regulator [Methanomicrobiales archaeon HGW-Methanomicrobiales-1]|jgi:predicted transcriptional regulator|nr:MAG: Crp/Fnr family transcriptional regulator [Methanomicrobiales archaeon HGW-Methanomicrobiales-1]